jgi:hypothetical protein
MRPLLTCTAAALAALALAACGGSGQDDGAGRAGTDRAQDGALAFARCMREHGIDMPDPQVDGGRVRFRAGGGDGPRPDDPEFRKAQEACSEHLRRGMSELPPERRAELRDAGVRYAACMREHGIDMPDPGPDGGFRIHRRPGESGPDLDSPRFEAANEACERHLADVRRRAPGGGEEER